MNIRQYLPLLVGSLALVLALGLVEWRQANPPWARYQPEPRVRTLVAAISGKPELCLTCHYGIEEISASHPVDVFGCVSCHGGDPLSLDEAQVHDGLLGPGGNPADLSVAGQTCGTAACHGGDLASNRNHILRVQRSLHVSYAGAIGAVLRSNGLEGGPQGIGAAQSAEYGGPAGGGDAAGRPGALAALLSFDPASFNHPAVTTFASTCLGCHLGAQPAAAPEFYRGTGCAACHTPYADSGLYQGGDPTLPTDQAGHPAAHTLTLLMPSEQCTHCHERGAYSLSSLTFTPRLAGTGDAPPHPGSEAALCERELDCIDCHTASETMGDGYLYAGIDSVPISECRTCHGTLNEPPPLVTLTDPNDPAFRRDALNPNYQLREGDTVVQAPDGDAMGAVRWEDGRLVLTSRITGQTFRVPLVQGSQCRQNASAQKASDCRECHAAP